MAQRIRRIDPLQTAKVVAAMYGLLGLIFVPIVVVIASRLPAGRGFDFGIVLGLVAVCAYAAAGFVFALLGAALYNAVAGWIGGIEIELE